jgi:phenylpyruvate tautomerase PptA (4-oxalocrotonate tautomerase family)
MPIVKIHSNLTITQNEKENISKKIIHSASNILKKSPNTFMVLFSNESIFFQGSDHLSALVEFSSIGSHSLENNNDLSANISQTLEETLQIPTQFTYLTFHQLTKEQVSQGTKTLASK